MIYKWEQLKQKVKTRSKVPTKEFHHDLRYWMGMLQQWEGNVSEALSELHQASDKSVEIDYRWLKHEMETSETI